MDQEARRLAREELDSDSHDGELLAECLEKAAGKRNRELGRSIHR